MKLDQKPVETRPNSVESAPEVADTGLDLQAVTMEDLISEMAEHRRVLSFLKIELAEPPTQFDHNSSAVDRKAVALEYWDNG